MHEKGYTFDSNGVISGLTQHEKDQIILGHIVAKEQEAEAQENAQGGGRRKHSEPAMTTDEKMKEYQQNNSLRSYQ